MFKIVLIGHDTRNANLGVGALTVSDVEIIRRVSRKLDQPLAITILTGGGVRENCVSGDDVSERMVRPFRHPRDYYLALRDADLVIDIAGGDSLTDIYGKRRIFQVLLQKYLVHLARRPLVIAPQTIGPFDNPIWRYLAAWSIRHSVIVASRDDKSTAFLRDMGVRGEVIEASDVALRLPYTAPDKQPGNQPGGRPKIGLNVSGLMMSDGQKFGLKADYPSVIREIIQKFLAHGDGCEVHLVGHVIGGIEDDYQACLKLAAEFPETIVAPGFETPSEAKSYIAGLDFFMGARMHACIAAFSSGVPVVPMAYSRKFAGLFGSLGYNRTVDCITDSADQILDGVFTAYEARTVLQQEIETARKAGLERLDKYEAALGKCIISIDRP